MSEPGEVCTWCGGKGVVRADANFLLARLQLVHRGGWRWIGRASDSMVAAAMSGAKPRERPYDGWDLGRCMVTRAVAPEHLHGAMDVMIETWARLLEKEKPYWGVDAARGMVDEHAEAVCADIAGLGREKAP